MASLEAVQAAGRHEEAHRHADIWEAILAILGVLGDAVPEEHARRAQAYLLRAGRVAPGDFTDAQLALLADTGGVREWRADMGEVREGEIITHGGMTYVVTEGKGHVAQAGWEPGGEGGRTLFRPLREEPDSGGALDFLWGERVPYGAKRRDPEDGNVYTPVKEAGVTLYEPHYPHLVPSEYKLVEDAPPVEPEPPVDPPAEPPVEPEPPIEPEPDAYPAWDGLADGHAFAVGDRFTDGGKTWETLRAFSKQADWRPPVLAGDFYAEI